MEHYGCIIQRMKNIGNAYRALGLHEWWPFFFELIMKQIF
jgi:hypothetical protein